MLAELSSDRRLLAVLEHELRNPLAAVVAGVSAAVALTEKADPRSGFLSRALDDLSRVSELLTRCLELAGAGRLQARPLDLMELLHRVAARQQGRVKVSSKTASIDVIADSILFERALENLLENAFAASASEVEIFVSAEGDGVILDVQDDGPGIPLDLQARIFEPFVSGRGSTGLGLAFVAGAMEAHGGSITFMGGAPGALFRLRLPSR